ncbi:MAG: siderophore-interacting protein [Chloroflexota bacterium]|nr:siderophore-interacting protein [Chloroflexota bacterium]
MPLTIPANLLAIPGVQPLELEVADVADLGPRMRRITLHGPNLDTFQYQPGQDLMLVLAQSGDRALCRRYTIRRHDPHQRTLELNIVTHGVDGIGARWASSARPGDRVSGVGPRGKIFVNPTADWHLFLGDESAAAATLAMLEALPTGRPAMAYLEVTDARDELPHSSAGSVTWLHRGDVPAPRSTLLADALAKSDLPDGSGQVYINGEVQLVSTLRPAALERGLAPDQVAFKAYWGRGKANAGNGEPEQRPV